MSHSSSRPVMNLICAFCILATLPAFSAAATPQRLSSPNHPYTIELPSEDWSAYLVSERSDTPADVISESVALLSPDGGQMALDVWTSPSESRIRDWIDAHLDVLALEGAIEESLSKPSGLVDIVTYFCASGGEQVYDTYESYFMSNDRVYRLSYTHSDEGTAQSAYLGIINTFSFTQDSGKFLSDERVLPPADQPAEKVHSCGGFTDSCLCGSSNPYPCCDNNSNCTWWAWNMACCNWGTSLPSPWRHAKYWVQVLNGQHGYPVSTTPSVNTIAVRNLGTYGHVAWVTAVNGNLVTVSEQSCNYGPGGVRTQVYQSSYFNAGYLSPLSSGTGVVRVTDGLRVTTAQPVMLGQDFSVTFTLQETAGAPASFQDIKLDVCTSDGTVLYTGASWSAVNLNANGNRTFTATIRHTGYPVGLYRMYLRGRKYAGSWVNLTPTRTGNSQQHFYAVQTYNQGFWVAVDDLDISPYEVYPGSSYTVQTTLRESWGAAAYFEQVAIAILNEDYSLLYDLQIWNGVSIPAWGTVNLSANGSFHSSNSPGVYHVMVRGRVPGGSWFDFSNTNLALNPIGFTATDGSGASDGFAGVSQGVSVVPGVVSTGSNFDASFSLQEIHGQEVAFDEVKMSILTPAGSPYADLPTSYGVHIAPGQSWTYAATGSIGSQSTAGTYRAVARGLVYQSNGGSGSWFDFVEVTGSGGASSTAFIVQSCAAPVAASNCAAGEDRCDLIVVTWSDNSSNESGFKVYRDGSLVGTTAANVTTYADVPAVGIHNYYVVATRSCGDALPSNADGGVRLDVPGMSFGAVAASTNRCSDVLVSWTWGASGQAGFKVMRAGSLVFVGNSPSQTAWYDSTAVAGTSYLYSVRAYNACGDGPVTASVSGMRSNSVVCNISPTALDFSVSTIGAGQDRTFTITNSGCGTMSGTITASCSDFSVAPTSYVVGVGGQQPITVTYHPSDVGNDNCTITCGAACSDVTCTGVGPAVPSGGLVVTWGQNYYGQCSVPSPNADFVDVAAGSRHSVGLKSDGTVIAWGSNLDDYGNYVGQCIVPQPNANFVAVSAGYLHTLALKSDGSIVAWGSNNRGQCNPPSPNSGFVAVAAGGEHSLGLREDGSIAAWGSNAFGQGVPPSENTGFKAIATSDACNMGLRQDGSIVIWGANHFNQRNIPSPNAGFTAIAAGYWHCLGLRSDGSVAAWGDNSLGQCNVAQPNTNFTFISAGATHGLGLQSGGGLVAWGYCGQSECDVPSPNSEFSLASGGNGFSLGLKRAAPAAASRCTASDDRCDEVLVTWTDNSRNETGFKVVRDGAVIATTVAGATSYVDSPAAGSHNYAVTAVGRFGDAQPSNVDAGALFTGASCGNVAFEAVVTAFQGVASGATVWGDFDSDGDLDLLATGDGQSRIWRNDAGTFVDAAAGLPSMSLSTAAWGDYDHDGDLDIALSGYTGAPFASRVYRNNGGVFSDIGAALTGAYMGALAWGDFDNDGDLDLLLTGGTDTGAGYVSRIYRNNAGTFVDVGAGLPGTSSGAAAWGDYDIDGDLDLVLTGNTDFGPGYIARVYRNDAGTFADVGAGLPGVVSGSVEWGDYDADGMLDLAITGSTGSSCITRIYHNHKSAFVDIGAGLPGVTDGAATWGDCDNDGDLDLALSGSTGTEFISRIYRNDAGVFVDIAAGLPGVQQSSLAWGDYDNDKDLDLVLSGTNVAGRFGSLYRSVGAQMNSSPTAPGSLLVSEAGDVVTLNWSPATDLQTRSAGLSYMLRIGTSPGGSQIAAAMSAGADGLRRVATPGNVQQVSWSLKLPPADFYWSVQAIDGSFAGGPFASEQHFVHTSGVEAPTVPGAFALHACAPNPFNPTTTIMFVLSQAAFVRLAVFDMTGRLVRVLVNEETAAGSREAVWNGLDDHGQQVASGVYMCCLEAGALRETRSMTLVR